MYEAYELLVIEFDTPELRRASWVAALRREHR